MKSSYSGTSTRKPSELSLKVSWQTSVNKPNKSLMYLHSLLFTSYLHHLFQESPPLDQFEQQIYSFNEIVQIPLQPLMDNLQSSTYDVFEKDHVKYQLVLLYFHYNT